MHDDLIARATRAYFRRCDRDGSLPYQPSGTASGVEGHKGTTYAVLRNIRGVIAVYRLTTAGRLAWCDSWPSAMN